MTLHTSDKMAVYIDNAVIHRSDKMTADRKNNMTQHTYRSHNVALHTHKAKDIHVEIR